MASEWFEKFRQERSRSALDHVIAEHWPMVLAVCRRYFVDPHDAEDAAQETFLKLVRHVDRITGNVSAWLSATAKTTCIDLLRKRKRHHARALETELLELTPREASDRQTVSWSMLLNRLDEAMSEVDPWARDLIVERFLRQTPLRVLAGQNNTSTATMSRRCAQALRQLGSTFEDMGLPAPDDTTLITWLQQVDPSVGSGNGSDGQELLHGEWPQHDAMARFRPGAEVPSPPGWDRPIRVGVLISWHNWSQPIFLGLFATPHETLCGMRYVNHPAMSCSPSSIRTHRAWVSLSNRFASTNSAVD